MIRSALLLALVCLAGCPSSGAPQPTPPAPTPGSGYQSGAPTGSACDDAGDCASGLCEGQGCGAAAGRCADPARVCTADAVEYCGCDGVAFIASSTCAGARYDHLGACVATATGIADGGACSEGSECASGTCEGLGCGADALGVCMSQHRACTLDLRQYCGCDGATFQGSGTCPNRRYASKGACAPPAPKVVGAACLQGSECDSGTCEGQGCGDDAPGVCVAKSRACTRDLRAYCGCDGQTFKAGGNCPGQRYAAKGTCPASR